MKLFTTLTLLAFLGGPAFADAPPTPPAQADFDPFKPLDLQPGDVLPPLKCMKREEFETAVKTHDGSKILEMTPLQAMFWRGAYATAPVTVGGYPIGDNVLYAVKVVETDDGKSALAGTIAFTLGEYIVCNVMPVRDDMLTMLFKAAGALDKDVR